MIAVYKVPDLEAAGKHLTGKGLKVAGRLQRGRSKEVIFSPEGAHGTAIVINEYPDGNEVGIEVAGYFADLKSARKTD